MESACRAGAALRYENGDEKNRARAVLAGVVRPRFLPARKLIPVRRDLIQLGYNQAFEGHAPLAGYAFYYHNQPDFLRTNLTLRLAVAPVYLDSELGFVGGARAEHGFWHRPGRRRVCRQLQRNSRRHYYPGESFDGDGGEVSASVYHLFNPGDMIPLNYVLRGTAHYSFYNRDNDTAPNFQLPNDHGDFSVRTGLRWGGVEPTLFPPLAMELSVWYEGHLRTDSGCYGINGDANSMSNRICFGRKPRWPTRCPRASRVFMSA